MRRQIKRKKPCTLDISCDVKKMEKFLEVLLPFCDFENFNRWAIFTHAFHETGGFKKAIGNNYFGIKKPKKWNGKVTRLYTHENVKALSGETKEQAQERIQKRWGCPIEIVSFKDGWWKIRITAEFADWETLPEALIWYGSLIKRLYSISFLNRENPEHYFIGLTAGKYLYASDPRYVEKLKNMYGKLRASEYIKNLVEK